MVVNVSDVGRAADFWRGRWATSRPSTTRRSCGREGEGVRVHLDETDRMHLDLWADDAAEQQAEVDRLLALGATRVEWDYPDDADFVVLADPDGNLFCVIDASA